MTNGEGGQVNGSSNFGNLENLRKKTKDGFGIMNS
jgi:hypothetical protein